MALDLGERRVGIAVSDPSGRVALPHGCVDAAEVRRYGPAFRELIAELEPDLLLCGLPLTLGGEEGPQAHRVRSLAGTIARNSGLPLEFFDERLSSEEAARRVGETGASTARGTGRVDAVAATLFLQAYLDGRRASGG